MDGERFAHADSERSDLDRLIWLANNALYDLNRALEAATDISGMQARDVYVLAHQTTRSTFLATFKEKRLPQS